MTDNLLMTAVQAAPAPDSAPSILLQLAPWLLVFAIFWVLVLRPQQKRVRDHQAELAAIKKGDDVITGGGIRGRVTKVDGEEAEVEIANGVRVRVVKSTISVVLNGAATAAND